MKDFWKNKNILVTGGTGFIGSKMVKVLLKKGSIVSVTTSKIHTRKYLENLFKEDLNNINIIKADLTKLKDSLFATKNIEIVLNFAALDGSSEFKRINAEKIYKINTKIVKNILEASKRNKVKRVLIMSSIDVYDKRTKKLVINEDSKLLKESKDYVGAKIYSEIISKEYYRKFGLKIAIARVGNVYGSGDTFDIKRLRVIPTFIMNAKNNKTIKVIENKKISFLYVDDLLKALLNLIEIVPNCNPMNIVGQEYIELERLAQIIIKLLKSKSKIEFIKNNSNDKIELRISMEKSKKNIHFVELMNLNKALKILIRN